MGRRKVAHSLVVTTASVLLAAGCGGGSANPSPAAQPSGSPVHGQPLAGPLPCKPQGPALTLSARKGKYSTECIAAPADQPFTIRFTNYDKPIPGGGASAAHNVGIYPSKAFHGEIFGEPPVVDETVTYHVEALPRGLYAFKCDIHPFMTGTLVAA